MDPCLVLIVDGGIFVIVYASLNGSVRPGCCQVVQEILGEGTSFEFRHERRNQLSLPILAIESSRVVEGGKMQTSYGNAVCVRVECHML